MVQQMEFLYRCEIVLLLLCKDRLKYLWIEYGHRRKQTAIFSTGQEFDLNVMVKVVTQIKQKLKGMHI